MLTPCARVAGRYVSEFDLGMPSDDIAAVLPRVARRIGALNLGASPNTEHAARVMIARFRQGRLGRLTLDGPPPILSRSEPADADTWLDSLPVLSETDELDEDDGGQVEEEEEDVEEEGSGREAHRGSENNPSRQAARPGSTIRGRMIEARPDAQRLHAARARASPRERGSVARRDAKHVDRR